MIEHETLEDREKLLLKVKDFTRKAVDGRLAECTSHIYSYPAANTIQIKNRLSEISTYSYDDDRGVMDITDYSGLKTSIINYRRLDVPYNGALRKIIDPKGKETLSNYYDSKTGYLMRSVGLNGIVTLYEYDYAGNISKISRDIPDIGVQPIQSFKYDKYNSSIEINRLDENGAVYATTSIKRNSKSQISSVTDPTGSVHYYEYNSYGYIKSSSDHLERNYSFKYDKYNNLISKTDYVGVETLYEYTAFGRVKSKKTYTKEGQLISSATHSHDSTGRLISKTDHRGRTIAITLDDEGRIIKEQAANGTEVNYSHDPLGRTNEITDQRGNHIGAGFNKFNKLAQRHTPANQETQYEYNKYGEMLSKTESHAGQHLKTSYTRDELGRLTKASYQTGESKERSYNILGQIAKTITKDKQYIIETDFTYDYFGRLVEKRQQRNHANGAGDTTVHRYTYDNADRRTHLSVTATDGQTLHYTWTYNVDGQLVSTSEGDKSVRYRYGNYGRLVEQNVNGTPIHYIYDHYGRLKSKEMQLPEVTSTL